MNPFDRLRHLANQIKEAQKKYYDLDFQYRQIIDRIKHMEADLLINGELKGKTIREKEAEAQLRTQQLLSEKWQLYYEANLAKADLDHLERQYKIDLVAAQAEFLDGK